MSDKEVVTFRSFKEWLGGLCASDLSDAEDEVQKALKRKIDEGRVTLLRVAADGINVAYFAKEDMGCALHYLIHHQKEGFGEVRIERVRIRESEVNEHLATRWWPI